MRFYEHPLYESNRSGFLLNNMGEKTPILSKEKRDGVKFLLFNKQHYERTSPYLVAFMMSYA